MSLIAMQRLETKYTLVYTGLLALLLNLLLNGEPLEEVDCFLSTWGRKWQPMEDVKGMWYTE